MKLIRCSMCTILALATAMATGACNNNSTPDTGVLEAGTVDVQDVPPTDTGSSDVQDVASTDATDSNTSDTGPTDGGGMYVDGCFVGTPVLMTDFLNRCTNAETANHTMMAPLVFADGGVPSLP